MHLPAVLIRHICIGLFALALAAPASASAEPKAFKLCWSIFAGWMPWGYAASEGIMQKWADKYGIRVEISEVPDYVGSIERYSAGEFDACSMTNMDSLTIPAAAGVDSTALIIGDFSNGADAILLRGPGLTLKDLKGKTVLLVENSVSHYLLSRALEWALLKPEDVTIQHVSDTQIAEAFRRSHYLEPDPGQDQAADPGQPGIQLQPDSRRDRRPHRGQQQGPRRPP